MTNYQTQPDARTEQMMRDSMRTYPGNILRGIVVFAALSFTATANADMGRTPGSHSVSPSGGASYTIPIWVQPGPKNLQPSMAFLYNSQSGNGTMGVGWSFSGFSSIERCPRTLAEDGVNGSIRLDANDRFCLNGNKLRITSGPLSSYSSADAVYQPQVATAERVTSVGMLGAAPESFLVHSKDGLIYEYGSTADSRVVITGTTAYRWMLNKVSDRDGNSYAITYTTSNSNGRVPLTVSWGPTSPGGSTYQYKATLNYSNKTIERDILYAILQGYNMPTRQRLDSLEIGFSASGSSHVTQRQYRLTYETSPTTSQSRLTEIEECGTSTSTCLKPTAITYQNGVAGVGTTGINMPGTASSVLNGKYDFNADGRSDIAYFNGTWRVSFSQGTGFGAGVDTGITSTPLAGKFIGPRQDGFLANVGGNWSYVGFNGTTFTSTPTGIPVHVGTTTYLTDYNGDNLQDLVWGGASGNFGTATVRLNTTSGSLVVPTFAASPFVAVSEPLGNFGGNLSIVPANKCPGGGNCDLNGDGRSDLLIVLSTSFTCSGGPGGCTIVNTGYDLITNGAGGYVLTNGTPNSVQPYSGFRFNDDRCMDTIRFSSTTLRVASCGTGVVTNVTIPAAPSVIMDWDGDGNSDMLVNNGGTFGVYRSTGSTSSPFDSLLSTGIPYSGNCFAIDVEGDGLDELACSNGGVVSYYSHNGGGSVGSGGGVVVFATQMPDLAASITDGYGNSVAPSYVSTAQSSYTKGSGTALPLVDSADPLIVVARMTVSDGIGGTYFTNYAYHGARRHATLAVPFVPWYPGARAEAYVPESDGQWVGFERITAVDGRNGTVSRSTFEQQFPLIGMQKTVEIYQSGGLIPIELTNHTNSVTTIDPTPDNQRYLAYRSNSNTEQYEVGGPQNGAHILTTDSTYVYGDPEYANLTSATTVVTDRDATSTPSFLNQTWTAVNTIAYASHDPGNWCVGLVSGMQSVQSSSVPGSSPVTRNLTFAKDASAPQKCRNSVKTIEPNSDEYRVTETYEFDAFGNIETSTVVGRQPAPGGGFMDMPARVTTVEQNAMGITPDLITDPMNLSIGYGFNADVGTLQKVVDPNSTPSNVIETSYVYDEFGRRTRQNNHEGTYRTWSYEECATSGGCISGEHVLTIVESLFDSQGALVRTDLVYADRMDRSLVSLGRQLNGTVWDGSYSWSEQEFDEFGRIAKTFMPCSTTAITTTCRSAATAYTYDLKNRVVAETRPRSALDSNLQSTTHAFSGRTHVSVDALGKSTMRVIDPQGSVRYLRDANGYALTFAYDAAGTLVATTDSEGVPKLSGVTIEYGAQAFPVTSTDPALGSRTRSFNSLGELIAWTDAKGQNFSATYDKLSRLVTRTDPDAVTTWTWGADPAARNAGQLEWVEIVAGGQTHRTSYSYDSRARLAMESILVPNQGTFNYEFAYDPHKGWLDTLTYPVSSAGYRLQTKYGYQNGLLQSVSDANDANTVFWRAEATDARGQTTREVRGGSIVTTLGFDAVTAQLTSIQSGSSSNPTAIQNMSFLQDLVGNVTQRQNNRLGLTETFVYGGPTDNLHRLGHSTLDAGAGTTTNLSLKYDLSGNILEKSEPGILPPNDNQSTAWTSYNYPSQITSGAEVATFAYGPDRDRWRMVFTNAARTETTHYIGNLLEKVDVNSSTVWRHTIMGASGPVAFYNRNGATGSTRYILRDHLGSVETITDAAGGPVSSQSFSAHGERRNPGTWSGDVTPVDPLDDVTRQGFTYHTALGEMGLNHMNGRVQDAASGRFMSPDPVIQDSLYTQNYNRYSYVYNNPATLTDPSGFWSCKPDKAPDPNKPPSSGGNGGANGSSVFVGTFTCRWDGQHAVTTEDGDVLPAGSVAFLVNDLGLSNSNFMQLASMAYYMEEIPVIGRNNEPQFFYPPVQEPSRDTPQINEDRNGGDDDGLSEEDKKMIACLRQNYGAKYDAAWDASIFSIMDGFLAYAADKVQERAEGFVIDEAGRAVTRQANRVKYSPGLHNYQRANNLMRGASFLKWTGRFLKTLTAGGTTFVATAHAKCRDGG